LPRAEEGKRDGESEREGDGKRGTGEKAHLFIFRASPGRVATRCARLPRGGGERRRGRIE